MLKSHEEFYETLEQSRRKEVRKQTPLGFVAHNLGSGLDLWLSPKFKGENRVKLPSVALLYLKILFKIKAFSG